VENTILKHNGSDHSLVLGRLKRNRAMLFYTDQWLSWASTRGKLPLRPPYGYEASQFIISAKIFRDAPDIKNIWPDK
jgi:hypothetical protein